MVWFTLALLVGAILLSARQTPARMQTMPPAAPDEWDAMEQAYALRALHAARPGVGRVDVGLVGRRTIVLTVQHELSCSR